MTINLLSVELEQDEKRKTVRLFQNEAAVMETESKGGSRCNIWERERGCLNRLGRGAHMGVGTQWLWVSL